jgi:hypothetical protein
MKVVCAWCGETQGYKCEACGGELQLIDLEGAKVLACTSGQTTIIFWEPWKMPVSHTICQECAAQARVHTPQPTLTDQEKQQIDTTEAATFKKRDPTEGAASDNTPQNHNRKPDGAP